MSIYCDDCGCRVYNGHCTNCHEDVYIAEQHYEQRTFDECSNEFKEKVFEQIDKSQKNK